MKLKELIEKVVKEPHNQSSTDPQELAELFGFYGILHIDDYQAFDSRMTGYWIHATMDSDTWVGLEAHFLDGEFVMLRGQKGRKSDVQIEFKDKEAKEKVKEFIFSYIEDEDNINYIKNINEEMYFGVPASYSDELLTDKLYDKEGNEFKIIEKFPRDNDFEKRKIVKVLDKNNNEYEKKLYDLLIPYRIN